MKKVLVTGATGFIGNYVIGELLREGCEIIATSPNVQKAQFTTWYDKVEYIPFDLRSQKPGVDYYSFFKRPDALIHLAWEGLPNYKSPFHLEENLPTHSSFLSNLIRHGLADLTVAGTCFEYGMQEGCLTEEMPAKPANPYAIAKDALRKQLVQLQANQYFELKWIRLFYMYGQGQSPNSLFSQLLDAIRKGEKVFNMSPGDQIRDFLDVKKAAEYIIAIALQNKVTGVINCCSGKPVEVKQFVINFLRENNKSIGLNLGYYPYSDLEPRNFWGDTTKLKTILRNGKTDS